jgi:hypothetical protein
MSWEWPAFAAALFLTAGGCARCGAPEPADAAPKLPSAATAPARDAAPDVTDARSDAGDGPPDAGPARHPAKKAAAPGGGGGAGFRVEGSLPRAEAEKVVRAGMPKLRACVHNLAGKVVFRLTVDARGRVPLGEVVTSTLGGGDPEMCMVRATRDFKFPAAAGESTVSFQMSFARR